MKNDQVEREAEAICMCYLQGNEGETGFCTREDGSIKRNVAAEYWKLLRRVFESFTCADAAHRSV